MHNIKRSIWREVSPRTRVIKGSFRDQRDRTPRQLSVDGQVLKYTWYAKQITTRSPHHSPPHLPTSPPCAYFSFDKFSELSLGFLFCPPLEASEFQLMRWHTVHFNLTQHLTFTYFIPDPAFFFLNLLAYGYSLLWPLHKVYTLVWKTYCCFCF